MFVRPGCVLQWSLTNDRWYSINPPPVEDYRNKVPNPWKDPNYNGAPDHLYLDYEYSARVYVVCVDVCPCPCGVSKSRLVCCGWLRDWR